MQNLSAAGIAIKRTVEASPNGNFSYRFYLDYYTNTNSLGVPITFTDDKSNNLIYLNLDQIERKIAHVLACGFLEPIFLKWLRYKKPSISWNAIQEAIAPVIFKDKSKSVKDVLSFTGFGVELLVDPTILTSKQIVNIGLKLSDIIERLLKTILAEGRYYVNELKDRVSAMYDICGEPVLIVVGNTEKQLGRNK